MMRSFFALLFAAPFAVAAQTQTPQVPHKLQFADMTLVIRDDARREIQKDVDALTQSPRHHNIKVERAKTYFPIIEKIFQEENVPDDFKYLVLQESALIADAVSVSKAVGFWQFKDFTAIEMGLRVDKEVDERMNIVSSSRAAARYIKKNNFYFNNWLFALQAYQMGAGAVMRSEKSSKQGEKNVEITSKTYWYIKKYLAHKVAFEGAVRGAGQIQVLTYENQSKKSLTDFAREVAVDETELKAYNKWVKTEYIPGDRTYAILIPVKGNASEMKLPAVAAKTVTPVSKNAGSSVAASARKESARKINGISIIEAQAGENATQLAARAGVDLQAFLKWNDISVSSSLQTGQPYLLGKKRARAARAYHTVVAGDNLWSVSQQYGVQIKKLKRYNRLDSDRDVKPGTTLWLTATRPKDADKVAVNTPVVQVDNGQTFAWDVVPADGGPAPSEKTVVANPGAAVVTPAVAVSSDTVATMSPAKEEPADSVKTLQVKSLVADSAVQQIREVVVVPIPSTHTVQPKETLYAIASQYNLAVMDLVAWNNLDLQQAIKPGQVLKLSDPQQVAERVSTSNKRVEIEHTVVATDTLYSVARKYGVTIKELMEWNQKKDFALSVGEKLKVIQK